MKRKVSLTLIISLCIAILLPYTALANGGVPPNLQISSNYKMPVFKAGAEARLVIPIRNVGGQDAMNIHVGIDVNTNPDVYPFEIENLVPRIRVSMIHAGSSDDIVLNYKVPASAKAKTYPLTVRFEYQSPTGVAYQSSETIYIKIENDFEQPRVNLHKTVIPNDALFAGETGKVIIDLHNNSKALAKDIEVRLSGFSPTTFYLTGVNRDTSTVAQLPVGHFTDSAVFDVTVGSKLATGVYTLDVLITYKDQFNGVYSNPHKIYIPVINKKDASQSNTQPVTPGKQDGSSGSSNHTPKSSSPTAGIVIVNSNSNANNSSNGSTSKLFLDNYSLDADYVQAGKDFTLSFSLFNTHEKEQIRNLTIQVSSDGDVFSPVNSIGTYYIKSINPQKRAEHKLHLRPSVDTPSKTHNLHLDIQYEDSKGNQYSTKEIIGIPVMQEIRLMVGQIAVPSEAVLGHPFSISTEYYNVGRANIRNLMIRLEGDFNTQDRSYYTDNLVAGMSNSYVATITPTQAGLIQGKIIFEFYDAIDQFHRVEKEFTVHVVEQQSSKTPYLYIGAGVLIIAAGGLFVYRHRTNLHYLIL
ncbi:hypothetical protein BHU72_00020 [Desulfuribacillus stibiiarsenatis]|uniref:CARDB domain-containing protein n=1 Tax=Desulfuribacillus stibiiarsenatis TaxID=1390249 RepID=A0A1E5L975_9FIRM|nr:hypothetical protein [Desulfuribacillus stibiiarsenatis]OEH86700.1 hypothetical protein BHU72_00020 [Desulfuribacillus stibiiarsenatis]